jgi:hypothetical protein
VKITRVYIWVVVFSLVFILVSACSYQKSALLPPSASGSVTTPSPTPETKVTLRPESPGPAIPADFLGLSYEDPVLAGNYFAANNRTYINLLGNLGQGVLRFGGNQLERTYWSRTRGATFPNARAVLAPADLDRLFSFAAATGWRVILGLNLAVNDPSMAADEATYAMSAGKDSILAFEIGNEPDLYSRDKLRPPNYTYSDFHREFESYLKTIRDQTPNAPIAGPSTANTYAWFSSFLADEAGNLVLSTDHYYPLLGDPNLKPTDAGYATIDKLLSQTTARTTDDSMAKFENNASKNQVKLRLGETNSVSRGGKSGVSDVFASALWGADYLFDLAKHGIAGVNVHGGFNSSGYTPIGLDQNGQYQAKPIYYGMLLFHLAAQGRSIPVDFSSPVNVTAYGFLGDDGTLRLAVINKDSGRAANCRIQTDKSYSQAGLIRLAAPSPEAQDGITLAGKSVNPDGTWSPGPVEPVTLQDTYYQFAVPAESASVLTLR